MARDTQHQFWQLVPPASNDMLYVHHDNIVHAVEWNSEAWPAVVLSQMYAEMGIAEASSSMYPFYRITVVETRAGEMVYYNSYDQEVWRTPAPEGYNPYLFAFDAYRVDTEDELSVIQKTFGRSSNVGLEILLLPTAFVNSYAQDVALDSGLFPLIAEPVTMAMESDGPPSPVIDDTDDSGGSNCVINLVVTNRWWVPSNFGSSTGEIFQCSNLVDVVSWEINTNLAAVVAGTNLVWADVTSSNIPVRFYILNDPSLDYDYDGLNDGREMYVHNTDPEINDTDADGLWDGWEVTHGIDPLDADNPLSIQNLPDLDIYEPTNGYPFVINDFNPPVSTNISADPMIAEWTRSADQYETVVMTSVEEIEALAIYSTTTNAVGTSWFTNGYGHAQMPADGMKMIWPITATETGLPIRVNNTIAWWLGPDLCDTNEQRRT